MRHLTRTVYLVAWHELQGEEAVITHMSIYGDWQTLTHDTTYTVPLCVWSATVPVDAPLDGFDEAATELVGFMEYAARTNRTWKYFLDLYWKFPPDSTYGSTP